MQDNTDIDDFPDIPGYRIISELGRGGIATVYLAIQESLDRQVALKVMSPLLAMEPDYAKRFIREGRTVAQLSHPNIITVYDIGLEKHQLFIAMEYIAGGNLRSMLSEHPNDPEWCLSVAGQIALALGYAHKAGIVHRDVKPENILFRENGAAVLTDFGIAKTITSSTNLTRAGTIIGTPKYMSPEQTDGLGNDPRTDIYSLGIILYEMLTGNVPYDSENSMAVLYAHVHSPVPELPESLSDLQPLINNMLAKETENRTDDCDALAEIIRITRRERHYALKDPSRHTEENITSEFPAPTNPPQSQASKQPAPGKRGMGGSEKRKQFDLSAILAARKVQLTSAALILGLLGLVFFQLPDNDQQASDDVATALPQAPDTADAGPATLTAPIESSELSNTVNSTQQSGSTAQENTPVANDAPGDGVIALDKNASNQSDQLISRFLADESNDELVKKRHAAAAAKVEADKKVVRISARQKKINKLLASARTAIKEEKILLPEEASAIALYNQVLEISPSNKRALRGLDLCGNLIFEKAKDLYFKDRPDLALQQINFALSKLPGHSKLESLKNTINASFNPNSSYAKAEKLYLGVDEVQDSSRAAFYYRKAAEGGHPQAMNAMGVAYADGDGVPRSDLLAMDWFGKSAKQENSEAMYNLALGYLFSDQADEAKAMVWARQAADMEYRPSYMLISWMTTTGTGAPANRFSSIAWDLKGMVNPISDELHGQYRIPKQWQEKFIREWEKATNTGP